MKPIAAQRILAVCRHDKKEFKSMSFHNSSEGVPRPEIPLKDLRLAAKAQLEGARFLRFDPPQGEDRRFAAVFEASPALEALIAAWHCGDHDELRQYGEALDPLHKLLKGTLLMRSGGAR